MAVNKVELANGEVLVDLTNDSVTPNTLAKGITAHDKSGAQIVGTYEGSTPEDLNTVLTEQEALIEELQDILNHKAQGSGGTDTRFADFIMDNLTVVDDDTITRLRPYALCYAEKLVSARLPNARISASSVFRNCTNLLSVDLPELAGTSGGSLFVYCSNLTSVNMPKVTTLDSYIFQYCTALKKLDLGNLTTIKAGAFSGSGLETLIIRITGTSITTLSSTNAFTGTPIEAGTGYIYVPSALIDKFKTATNWSTYANQFKTIEGSEYE